MGKEEPGRVNLLIFSSGTIVEGFIQKPTQTVVVAFWGKMAAHLDCVADELIKAGLAINTVFVLIN